MSCCTAYGVQSKSPVPMDRVTQVQTGQAPAWDEMLRSGPWLGSWNQVRRAPPATQAKELHDALGRIWDTS